MTSKSLDRVIMGQNIRNLRIHRGYTQAALAKRMNCSVRQVCRLESGSGGTSVLTFLRLCNALGCLPGDILKGTE